MNAERERIAVVGSGIAGLFAAWVLRRRHDVVLFEADDRVGGHTNTIELDRDGKRLSIDTGFIVYNERTYPLFSRLLERLDVATQPSTMSFSVHCEATGLEYNGTSLNTLFAQRRNLLRPSFWRMIRGILRFNREATALLDDPDPALTLGEFLERRRFGPELIRNYLVPMGAAVWSTAPEQMLGFPAHAFARFFHNHGFLSIDDRPQWRVIQGGSQRYVERMLPALGSGVRTSAPVEAVTRGRDGVTVKVRGRDAERFDRVVLACHSDQALRILADPSDAERRVLGAIAYQENVALLHTDSRLMPRRRLAQAAWNYHLPADPQRGAARVTVTYDMNALQSLRSDERFLVTLNREADVDPAKVIRRIVYHHPLYTREAVAAQVRRAEISGPRRTHYCGAYWRNGFHEDGVWSGLLVCRELGMDFA
ncbi:MAG: FAD-dependent oxidoreductase [Planctomycetota bacterium]